MSNGFMKTQLKKIGLSLVLAAMPFLAISTASAQLTQSQTGVSVMMGDTSPVVANISNRGAAVVATPTHTIALNQRGVLEGRVASIDAGSRAANGLAGLNVFFVRDGQVIRQAQTAGDGSFSIGSIAPGPYSFFAAGNAGVAAYGVYVSSQNNGGAQNILEATTASSNYAGIQHLLRSSVPQPVLQSLASATTTSNQGTQIPVAKQIQLVNSRLQGRISSLYQGQNTAGIQVQLIQNDQPIAQVQTDASGGFSVPDLQPGVYDFVAAGQNGFATGRFEAVGANQFSQVSYRRTATQLDACLTCPAQAAPIQSAPIDYAVGNDVLIEPSYSAPVEYAGESIAYGGASGGTCGACSNYSGFSGGGVVRGRFGGGRIGSRLGGNAGRFLLIGGLGAGIVAIADDDPDNGSNAGD